MSPLIEPVLSWASLLNGMDLAVLFLVWAASYLAARGWIVLYAMFTLPGTFAHEMMHFLVAFVLGARPTLPSIIPTRTPGGWQLGSVECRPGLLSRIPIALAPILLAPVGLWWAATHMHAALRLDYLLHAWIAGTLVISSTPSSQDWWVAAPAFLALALLGWFVMA